MRLDGSEDISPVVFWDDGAQPLPGAVTLEIFSLGIDPVNERLIHGDAFILASGTGWKPHRSKCVNPDKDRDRTSKDDSGNRSRTPSVDKLNRLIGPSPAPRNLTPYEIELLRKAAEEVAEVTRQVLAEKDKTSQR